MLIKNVYIVNNTVANNGWNAWGSGIYIENTNVDHLEIINNLVSRNTGFQIKIPTNLSTANYSIQYNLVDNSNRGWRLQGSGDTLGQNAINALPNFVAPNSGYFGLAKSSPAIGIGAVSNIIPSFDFRYKPRLSGIDIGAFQF